MGPYYPWWGPMCGFPSIMPIIMVMVAIVALCLIFGRGRFCSPWQGPDRNRSPESALEILKKRYTRGEITKDEFERMKQDILI